MLSVADPESLLPSRRLKLRSFLPAMRRTADHPEAKVNAGSAVALERAS
jgi:hypothetical protein